MLLIVYNVILTANSAHQPQNVRSAFKDIFYSLTIHVLLVNYNVCNVQIQRHVRYALIALSILTQAPNYAFQE